MGLLDKFKKNVKHEKNGQLDKSQTKRIEPDYVDNQTAINLTKQLSLTYKEKAERVSSLTTRENDTYLLLIEGMTLKEVAKQLGIKYSTANTYMTGIYKKLKVNTRAELIIYYRNIRE